ncbi:uncharacterized protein LOC110110484 isoform X1 [Dendrobium catenatum]|uniref:uncharacterized protein LOC110110484 isoform X1 n=1 Tax=Dendrobium catenatum TaxID=906689 RepID=UPI0009F2588E|nr:uncharacterized protein LOC110110484 isoform X1 [Dendrobium catenatum]
MLFSLLQPLHSPILLPLRHFRCKCSGPDISFYRDAFARKMALAGIKPHHRIALGVSGGSDSMALCVLTAGWKSEGFSGKVDSSGYIDGLLGIVVDHRLRPESVEEARIVQERAMKMGIRCEISCCIWPDGRPKVGDLQEAAREMRYQIFQDVCAKQHIGVLLVAHHADDQSVDLLEESLDLQYYFFHLILTAELFILRLSRNSGVFGLAGMAFVSQLFSAPVNHPWSSSSNNGVLLVRPMLELSKGDMYEICQGGKQIWVEDPTNQCTLFTRNRIRIALKNLSSSSFSSEMKALVSACRLTRLFIENISHKMLEESVSIMNEGYSIIDLEKLDPLNVDDLCLSRFLVMIVQFISQRQRPIRGSAMKLLLEYIRNIPCKTSLTAAGCYLCAAPGSKGKKIIVCYSPESPLSSNLLLSSFYCEEGASFSSVIEQIVKDAKFYSNRFVAESPSMPFLRAKSSEAILREAVQIKLISQSTYNTIRSLQMEEHDIFCSQNGVDEANELGHRARASSPSNVQIYPGQSYHFMCRFLLTWKLYEMKDGISSNLNEYNPISEADGKNLCQCCRITQEHGLIIRHMVDADWLYLAKLSESQTLNEGRNELETSNFETGHHLAMEHWCSSYLRSSVQTALQKLKYVPAAARRALPVLVNSHNLPICIPSIGFSCCPFLSIEAEFRPRVPLGGGYRSFL